MLASKSYQARCYVTNQPFGLSPKEKQDQAQHTKEGVKQPERIKEEEEQAKSTKGEEKEEK